MRPEAGSRRDNIGALLRDVEAGNPVRVIVRGRPVAELLPISGGKDHLTPDEVRRILRVAPLDVGFPADVEAVARATIDEV